MAALTGWKTYLVCIVGVLYAIVSYWNGSMDFNTMIAFILGAGGIGGLRSGVTTAANTAALKMGVNKR